MIKVSEEGMPKPERGQNIGPLHELAKLKMQRKSYLKKLKVLLQGRSGQ